MSRNIILIFFLPVIGLLALVQTCYWLASNRNILSGNRGGRCGCSGCLLLENS